MKKKIVSAICMFLMLASIFVFAGCGGSGDSSSSGGATISGSGN